MLASDKPDKPRTAFLTWIVAGLSISTALGAEFVVDFTLIVMVSYCLPKSVLFAISLVVFIHVSLFIAAVVILPTSEFWIEPFAAVGTVESDIYWPS